MLDGLYVGLSLRPGFSYVPIGTMDAVVFFPDGSFVWWFPQEGLDGFDRNRSILEHPNFWGTYRVEADRIVLRYSQGSGDIVAQKLNGGQLSIPNLAVLTPVSKLNGHKLKGTYTRVRNDPFFPSHCIIFSPDGNFEDAGAINDLGLSFPNNIFLEIHPGMGTYRISNNTLTLSYANGGTLRVCIFILDIASPDIFIYRSLHRLS